MTYDVACGIISGYKEYDDVFSAKFLKSILLVTTEQTVAAEVLRLFGSWGCRTVYLIPPKEALLEGPLFFSSSGIFKAWRLYPDTQEAFVMSTVPVQGDPMR